MMMLMVIAMMMMMMLTIRSGYKCCGKGIKQPLGCIIRKYTFSPSPMNVAKDALNQPIVRQNVMLSSTQSANLVNSVQRLSYCIFFLIFTISSLRSTPRQNSTLEQI